MAVGEDWGPEDLTGAHPAILKKKKIKKNGRKKKQKGKKKKKKKCFVRRARGIPWAVSLNKPGVKHPPAPPTPHTLHFSSHSLTLALYQPSPPTPPHSLSPPDSPPLHPPISLQSDRGIIVPRGFRWCDISVTWRRAVSCSPEEPRLPVGCRGERERERVRV